MNIYDISHQSGVSIATVSRVINNSGYVSEKTRAKVMKVIEENNYSPNAFARGMANSTMSTIGILCSDAGDLYQAQCIHFLEPLVKKEQFAAILSCTGYDETHQEKDLQMLLDRNVDAIILIGSHFISQDPKKNEYIVQAAKRIPVCLLNGYLDAENVFCILHDDQEAEYKLTELVLEGGAESPIFLYRNDSPSTRKKKKGCMDACKEHNIVFTDENGIEQTLDPMTPVSMNMWGFTPDYFDYATREFTKFLERDINIPKSEQVIPDVADALIKGGEATIKVLDTDSRWFGVTYAEDRPGVVAKFAELGAKGEYPEKMF